MIQFKREKKITKREYYEGLKDLIIEGYTPLEEQDLIDFLDKEIGLLDDRADKESERRAESRAEEGTSIVDAIMGVLTNDRNHPKTSEDIVKELNIEGLTPSMVVARITPLVRKGRVRKVKLKIDKRDLIGYFLAW